MTIEEHRDHELNKLVAFVCTCKKKNTPEWMGMLADRINKAIEACGSNDRVKWPGKWANEFQLETGCSNVDKLV